MPCYPRGAERRTGLVREVDRADLDDRAARRQPERGRDLLEGVSVDASLIKINRITVLSDECLYIGQ
jgi:hypothetical protein